ncbi:MAG TPA: ribosome-associated translation inhibitor RaiA [Allosphingosinicella sp.]|nr:ribosome-associated translation inhibitor RaiA [Allosphingosinicella sp.]
MDIRVSGHQLDTGEALQERAGARLAAVAEKYASRLVSAQVTFGKGPHDHGFTCEIVAYAPQGVVLKAADRAASAPAAFDAAADKVEKQLRRHSRRLKDHHADTAAVLVEADGFAYRRGGSEPQGE